jgi:hypothetical protein
VFLDRLRIISPEEWGVNKYSIHNIRPRPLQELNSRWGTLYKPLILNAKRIQNLSDANLSFGGKCIYGVSRFELGLVGILGFRLLNEYFDSGQRVFSYRRGQ